MKQAIPPRLEQLLETVEEGCLAVERHPASAPAQPPAGRLTARVEGKGRMDIYPAGEGIEASYTAFCGPSAAFRHPASPEVLEVFYCRSGRVGWNMQGGTALYLGPGDTALHSAACCADSAMLFPLGYAEGLSVSIDLPRLGAHCPPLLEQAGLDAAALQAALCAGPPAAIAPCPATEAIFGPLFAAPPRRRPAYLALKVQELLLYLLDFRPGQGEPAQYPSRQTELIRAIHRQLTQQLDRRFTIEQLAREYLINTSTLKEVFKAVYGLPIAAYMKEYRIRRAMELLRTTDAPIAEIARAVGYETPGKFSQAFRDLVQMLPREYRKNCR